MMLSLDGYFEGPNHDLSWHNVDDEFNKFAIEQLKEADLLLFGRRTYQLMEAYWPKAAKDPAMSKENLEIANLINNANKIVFSRTLDKVEETESHVSKIVSSIEILKAGAIYVVSKGAWLYNNCSYSLSTNLLRYYYDKGLGKYHMSSIHLRVCIRNLEDVLLKRNYIWVCYDCYFRCTSEDQKNNHQLTTNHSKFVCFD
jgi:dihydrofolate reductase